MVTRTLILLCFALLSFSSLAANITVQVDRDPVTINESFKIIFEADDSVSDTPDFTPLKKDFEILSRNQSSNMQFINGSVTRQTRWTLFAMAKRSGKFTIPSIRVGNDNSPSINITVNEKAAPPKNSSKAVPVNQDLFIEVEAKPDSAYVQQQTLYTIRFYRAVTINGASMSEPSISGGDVVIEKLGDDSSFETRRNNRRYVVIERRYALFPQQSGDIVIEPITLDAQVVVAARGMFDPFGQNSTTKRLKSDAIALTVKPVPASMRNKPWLPSSDLKLTESWSQQPEAFVVGEPITRTLTIKAEGLTAAQLPSLAMADTHGFKAYPDQPRLNDKRGSRGISGTRQEKIALIPTQAGQLTLPAIKINWWNTSSNKMETASLPARTVRIQPGENTAHAPAAALPQPSTVATKTTTPATEAITIVKEDNGIYSKLSIVLGLGWLITVIAWLISAGKGKTTNTNTAEAHCHAKASLNAVKKACLSNNPQQSKTELINWAKGHWPDKPPANIAEIGNRLNEATQQEIEKLNQALYGATTEDWQGSRLWQQLSVAVKTTQKKARKQEQVLVPLYP